MAEWLYAEAGQITPVDADLRLNVSSNELWDGARAFGANIDRIHEFWKLAPHIMEQGASLAILLRESIAAVTGQSLLADHQAKDPEIISGIIVDMQNRIAERFLRTGSADEAARYNFDRAMVQFDALIQSNPEMDAAIYATLSAQLTSAWTAFEALCSDLWLAVKSKYPHSMAPCRNRGDYSFQTRQKIREAFGALIPQDNRIDTVLGNPDARKLNIVRNLLIHKAGVVDQMFLDQAADIPWNISEPLGKPIELNGGRVKHLVNPVVQMGVDLIHAVDKWMMRQIGGAP